MIQNRSEVEIMILSENRLMTFGIIICLIAGIISSFYYESPPLMIGIGILTAFIVQKLRQSREESISKNEK